MADAAFLQATSMLAPWLRQYFANVSVPLQHGATEIRLRAGQPVAIQKAARTYFLGKNGESYLPQLTSVVLDAAAVGEALSRMCEYSVYAHKNEIENGYLTIEGGHRVGVCGTARRFQKTAVEHYSSLNIRIARQHIGCATALADSLFFAKPVSLLLAGSPVSGKTTLLRDLIRQFASQSRFYKTAVVDERGELSATFRGTRAMDLGLSCDVLDGYSRPEGFEIAVRSLSPAVIACDELGTAADCGAALAATTAGVKVVATAHAGSLEQLRANRNIAALLESGVFEYIALLKGEHSPGSVEAVLKASEML